ncbi:retinol-binding protein 1 isoform X4 [Nyctibius grandis]
MIIKTLSAFRNYIMEFDVGKEFEEDLAGVDDRKCMTTVSWDGDKLLCVQNGEKEGRGWTQWIEGDEMHLRLLFKTPEDQSVPISVHTTEILHGNTRTKSISYNLIHGNQN